MEKQLDNVGIEPTLKTPNETRTFFARKSFGI
jgi:hypothetical protein